MFQIISSFAFFTSFNNLESLKRSFLSLFLKGLKTSSFNFNLFRLPEYNATIFFISYGKIS